MAVKSSSHTSIVAVAILFVAGILSGCASIETGAYADDRVSFAEFKTFSWLGPDPYIKAPGSAPINPLAHSMITAEIRNQFAGRGFVFTDDRESADLLVSYTIGERDKLRMQSYPVGFRGHWGWHAPYSHYYFRKVELEHYTQGTLGIDVFDNESGRPIWHGWARKTVTAADRRDPGPTIEKGIAKLFESFPG